MVRRPPFTALVTSLFAVWLVVVGLVPAASPRVQAQDTGGGSLTFACGSTPGPCEVPAGEPIVVSGRGFTHCSRTLSVVVELVNPQGVAVVPSLGSVTFCNNFDAKFTVPSSVAPGGYRVLLRFPAEPGRPAPRPTTSRDVLTVTRPAGEGNLSGIADCGRGALPGALVELFSGHTFVTSTLAMEPDGRFVFNVAPGQYSVRIQRKTEVCGGPAIAPNPRVPVQPLLDLGNHSWPRAFRMTLTGGTTKSATADEHLFLQDQSAWFKFRIQPGSQVTVTLTGGLAAADPLPENYDLTLYKDIAAAFKELNSQEDLVQLQAESAPDAFTPDAFTPDAFTPDAFTPDAFTPDAFTPDAFTPDAFTPDAFTPDAFTPDAFTPDAFTPDAFTPDAFTPDAFTPDAFTPDAFTPDAFTDGEVSPEAFAGAQTRSLIAVSAFNGTSGEGVRRNTWDNTTDFYVRVRGRNGAFSLAAPFHLTVTMDSAECEQVVPITQGGMHTPSGSNFKTLILTDLGRLAGTPTEKSSLVDEIESFALLPEVGGKFVNFETGDKRIEDARLQADGHPACPFAKNVLAGEIKRLIDSYRALNPGLEYIVLIGNDEVVPFFRDPDEAGLASEKMYAPPVLDTTASQASLKLGYVLTQDRYGARRSVSRLSHTFPMPDLAVGRLIETAVDATGMLQAYPKLTSGVLPQPTSGLVTGYDFLADAATAIKDEMTAGLGQGATMRTLIQESGKSPSDPSAWTADQLRAQLLGNRNDVTFLGGHFSQSSALAADFTTRMISTELLESTIDLTNAVIFSVGCHSGYNTVDPHAVQGVTPTPDWGQTFARKRATFIGGTGYQYGETDIIDYSERLYLEFTRALRTGTEPVAIGKALFDAKRTYLANTPVMRGIHEKAILEATLFGLPMLKLDMPGARITPPSDTSIITGTAGFTQNPGAKLALRSAEVSIATPLNEVAVPLTNTATQQPVVPAASYLQVGNDPVVDPGEPILRVVSNPGEPILPKTQQNVSVPNHVLRGVGFRSGTYTDSVGVRPLTGAPSTEIRTPHVPFASSVFYPARPWSVNYFDALNGGATRLEVTPAQFQSTGPELGTRRAFSNLGFKLYYSNNVQTFPTRRGTTNIPGLAAAPAISKVSAVPNGSAVDIAVDVGGDPGVGIQEVWVTYTGVSGPFHGEWVSQNLGRGTPSNRWTTQLTLPPNQNADHVRFMVQAVNGVGLVTLATNLGTYYTPGPDKLPPTNPKDATRVDLLEAPRAGVYREQVVASARLLTSNGQPIPNQELTFGIGPARRTAVTDRRGIAQATLALLQTPGNAVLQASFEESDTRLGAVARSPISIAKQGTELQFNHASASAFAGGSTPLVATLRDRSSAKRVLLFQTVVFVIQGGGRTFATTSITNLKGEAPLGAVGLPAGMYTVEAHFGRSVPVGGGQAVDVRNDRYNESTARANLVLTADTSVPSCLLSGQGVDKQGRRYVEVTVRDTGAGVASITPTDNSSNVNVTISGQSALYVPRGTTAPIVVRGTQIKPAAGARVELRVVDAAVPANTVVCDPVTTAPGVGPRGSSDSQIFTQIPR